MKTAVTYLKMAAVLSMIALIAAGCGRKNELRLPDPNPRQLPRERAADDAKGGTADQSAGPGGPQSASAGPQGEGEEGKRKRGNPDKPFILDPLIQ
ncbi:hypothetical protein K1W69_26540 [Hoeflea sp. WL0058]|uniref:Lipoprotein n=1 Tax=Flavimaribacter sediminis TaxID=2865987 RepID=A0AAE3D4F4_9HYPH|nr:hypothetical protein [Flavimaribacter sediminis]MBW8640778.1 hypothetical protein [Flavimaribacter sediminis]